MKANEAPEKVYKLITTGDLRLNGYHEYKPAKIRYNDKIIEYIRKDIVDGMLATAEDHAYFAGSESQRVKLEKIRDNFINKACRWIRENITNNPHANSVLVRNGCVTLGMLVDDFKKYMTKE